MSDQVPDTSPSNIERLVGYWLDDLGEREGRPPTRANAIDARWKGGMRKLTADEASDFDGWARTRVDQILHNPDAPEGVRYKARQDQEAVRRWLKEQGHQ